MYAHLPSGLHTFPNTEEADDPHSEKTKSQVPFYMTQLLDTIRDAENISPVVEVTFLGEELWIFMEDIFDLHPLSED